MKPGKKGAVKPGEEQGVRVCPAPTAEPAEAGAALLLHSVRQGEE